MLETTPVTIPSYIYVPALGFSTRGKKDTQGDSSSKFVDVWIYEKGKLLGNIGLPALIPIQKSGLTELSFDAGVLKSGQDDQRIPNPFTDRQTFYRELTPNKIDTFTPVITYLTNAKFSIIEGFESNGFEFTSSVNNASGDTIQSVAVLTPPNSGIVLGNKMGKVIMAPSSLSFEIDSKEFTKEELQPSPSASVYLELDYKSETAINIGMYSQTTTGVVQVLPIFSTFPSTSWNKVYICLDQDISPANAGTRFKIAISISNNGASPEVYIDNIKLVHF
jgi:hypothetical protein